MPWLATTRVRAQNPRDDVTSIGTVLGQTLAWQLPWHLRVHEPIPGYADSILLEAPQVQFAFVLHERDGLPFEYQSPRGYRDSLIDHPEWWDLEVLASFSDERGAHAVVVGTHTDRVYYYCVTAIDARYLLELGLYADIDSFEAGWESAKAISLDGQPIYGSFDEARILNPLDARMIADAPASAEDAEQTYLLAIWAFYFGMRASTEQLQAKRRQIGLGELEDVIAPVVTTWTESIQRMQTARLPGPDFDELDSLARNAVDAYTIAAEQYETMMGHSAQSRDWAAFFNEVALAEIVLGHLKQELDRWEIPAQDA